MKIAGPKPRYCFGYWPAARAARAALQASDSLALLASMQARRSGPVLSAQNFCASSRQAAMPPPPPAGACAKAGLAASVAATISILIFMGSFLVVVAPPRRQLRPPRRSHTLL